MHITLGHPKYFLLSPLVIFLEKAVFPWPFLVMWTDPVGHFHQE